VFSACKVFNSLSQHIFQLEPNSFILLAKASQGQLPSTFDNLRLNFPSLRIMYQNVRPVVIKNARVVFEQLLEIVVDDLSSHNFVLNEECYILDLL